MVNFADHPVTVDAGEWTVVVATRHERDGQPFDGRLGAAEAVLLS
jgi:hypothetical protein